MKQIALLPILIAVLAGCAETVSERERERAQRDCFLLESFPSLAYDNDFDVPDCRADRS